MTDCDRAPPETLNMLAELTQSIEQDLLDRHGPLIADEPLRIALGYRSMEAFRQAMSRGTLTVPIFSIPNRRGKYALVKDVAAWLAALRYQATPECIGAQATKGRTRTFSTNQR